MKKIGIILLSICVGLIVLHFTRVLSLARIPTPANEPNIKTGSFILFSSLFKPARFEFMVYKYQDQIYLKRLIGLPGDKVEIKAGKLYVNGKPEPSTYRTNHAFLVDYKFVENNPELFNYDPEEMESHPESYSGPFPFYPELTKDTMLTRKSWIRANLDPENLPAGKYSAIQLATYKNLSSKIHPIIQEIWNEPWNEYNFGPLSIPADCYFVLGDNREYSQDSRFTGFILKKDIIGGLLYP